MNYWNIKEIEKILENCGNLALEYYNNPGYELKDDKSIVTNADKAIENYLGTIFNKPENNSFMLGEETILNQTDEYIQSALEKTVWIIDPIDGTAPYSHHIPTWGISIAFAEKGEIKEGAIFLPAIGEMFISDKEKIFSKKRIINDSKCSYTELSELNIQKSSKNVSLISITQETTKYNTLNIYNPLQSICSAVFSMTQLLQKRYLAYVLSRHIKIWDFAAGLALLQKAGFTTLFRNNKKLPLSVNLLCDLNKKGTDRWKLKSEAVFSIDNSSFKYIVDNISF